MGKKKNLAMTLGPAVCVNLCLSLLNCWDSGQTAQHEALPCLRQKKYGNEGERPPGKRCTRNWTLEECLRLNVIYGLKICREIMLLGFWGRGEFCLLFCLQRLEVWLKEVT